MRMLFGARDDLVYGDARITGISLTPRWIIFIEIDEAVVQTFSYGPCFT